MIKYKQNNFVLKSMGLFAAGLIIVGCQTTGNEMQTGKLAAAVNEAPVSTALAPAEKPALPVVGETWQGERNGKPITWTVTAIDAGIYSGEDSRGCTYKELAQGFAPSLEWNKCSGNAGSQTITKNEGSPWPMTLDTTFSYRFTGRDNKGDTWSGKRSCEVADQVRVAVPLGEYDTYKVKCKDPWSVRTWWYAPEVGRSVAYVRKHNKNPGKNVVSLVSKKGPAQ